MPVPSVSHAWNQTNNPRAGFPPPKPRLCTTLGHGTRTDRQDKPPRAQNHGPVLWARGENKRSSSIKPEQFQVLAMPGWGFAAAEAVQEDGRDPGGAPRGDHHLSRGPDTILGAVGMGVRAGAGTFLPPQCHCIYFSHGDSLLRTRRHFSNAGRLKEALKSFSFWGGVCV